MTGTIHVPSATIKVYLLGLAASPQPDALPDLDVAARQAATVVLRRHRPVYEARHCERCSGVWLPPVNGAPAGCRQRRAIAASLDTAGLLNDALRRLLGLPRRTREV